MRKNDCTPEQWERYLDYMREYRRENKPKTKPRSKLTPEQREHRRAYDRAYMQEYRKKNKWYVIDERMRRRKSHVEQPGIVYFIRAESGPVKIGVTTNGVAERLQALQSDNHELLQVVGQIKSNKPRTLERKLHAELEDNNIRGEWFAITVEKVKVLERTYYD